MAFGTICAGFTLGKVSVGTLDDSEALLEFVSSDGVAMWRRGVVVVHDRTLLLQWPVWRPTKHLQERLGSGGGAHQPRSRDGDGVQCSGHGWHENCVAALEDTIHSLFARCRS